MSSPIEIIVAGAGRIGSLISGLLAHSNAYSVHLIDINPKPNIIDQPNLNFTQLDVTQITQLTKFVKQTKASAIISCLPYYRTLEIAEVAAKMNLNYFDLTEDVRVREQIKKMAKGLKTVFVPNCGLAPGFVNIVAQELMSHFQDIDEVKLRVGCLPFLTDNALHYALTWSTDGIINQYGNPCQAIVDGKLVEQDPLINVETIFVDGMSYEAFNTSGGVGSLIDSYKGKVRHLNYKTIRYPGHCEKMKFLMQDLKLNENRPVLKQILESVLPQISDDVTIVYVTVQGIKDGRYHQELYSHKFYPKILFNQTWTSIQITTASSACAAVDILLNNPRRFHGFVPQEKISLPQLLNNQFGRIFQ